MSEMIVDTRSHSFVDTKRGKKSYKTCNSLSRQHPEDDYDDGERAGQEIFFLSGVDRVCFFRLNRSTEKREKVIQCVSAVIVYVLSVR